MGNTVPDVNALSELRSILGPKGYSDDQDVISPWLTDWRGRFTGAAAALLSPATTEEVAAIVRVAAKYGLSLVPQGGNSGMVAGATPNSSGNQSEAIYRCPHARLLILMTRLQTNFPTRQTFLRQFSLYLFLVTKPFYSK